MATQNTLNGSIPKSLLRANLMCLVALCNVTFDGWSHIHHVLYRPSKKNLVTEYSPSMVEWGHWEHGTLC